MNIGIIGAGVMGSVIVSSLIKKNIVEAGSILVSDHSDVQLKSFEQRFKINTTKDNLKLLDFADIVLFCVKPQKSREMMQPLTGHFKSNQVIVSIMAGVSIETIGQITAHDKIVRSMPNIPARIGEGMTVWMASDAVPDSLRMIVKMIFQAFGLESRVTSEDMIDAATAISGSGPAYIFYFAENLVNAALNLNFSLEESTKLVQQTFKGAMDLWYQEKTDPETLRRSVTSKGGTTEAALKRFKKLNTPEIFLDAINQAYIRAGELKEVADGKPDPNLENQE